MLETISYILTRVCNIFYSNWPCCKHALVVMSAIKSHEHLKTDYFLYTTACELLAAGCNGYKTCSSTSNKWPPNLAPTVNYASNLHKEYPIHRFVNSSAEASIAGAVVGATTWSHALRTVPLKTWKKHHTNIYCTFQLLEFSSL